MIYQCVVNISVYVVNHLLFLLNSIGYISVSRLSFISIHVGASIVEEDRQSLFHDIFLQDEAFGRNMTKKAHLHDNSHT